MYLLYPIVPYYTERERKIDLKKRLLEYEKEREIQTSSLRRRERSVWGSCCLLFACEFAVRGSFSLWTSVAAGRQEMEEHVSAQKDEFPVTASLWCVVENSNF